MKRVVLLGSLLLFLFWAPSGAAVAQPLAGLTGPLDDVVDKITDPLDKVKTPVEKALPPLTDPVKKPVEDITKEVVKVVDTVVKDVTEVAKNPAEVAKNPPSSPGEQPNAAPEVEGAPVSGSSEPESSVSGASPTKLNARSSGGSGQASRGVNRAEATDDTDQVAAGGHAIAPAEVRGTQIIAPASEVDESEGSNLSVTGAQILTWLVLACGLLAAGAAFVRAGRIRVRTASS